MLSKAEVISLCKGTHGDPFALLGLHTDSKSRLYLRSLQPGALSVSAIDAETGEVLIELDERKIDALGDSSGFFEASIVGRNKGFNYRLRIKWPSGTQELDDPYRFPTILGEMDVCCLLKALTCALSSTSARICARSTASRELLLPFGHPMHNG